ESKEIVVGMSNDRMVEIKEGLKEGDQVVLNPKRLVGDTIKTRRPGGENGNGGNGSSKPAGTGPARDRPMGANPGGMPPGPGGGPGGGAPGGGGPPGGARPQGGPGGPGAAGGQGGGQVSQEDRQKQFQAFIEDFKKASPEERKKKLDQIPEDRRERVK